ncbi:DUF1775 domain-containing protein [Pseudonocardiaceae bacterium YIM PH 21723]|nr:DUF1775 domain-containing protein [Pseudonocardiaceae bacterium YIM PH 21723]
MSTSRPLVRVAAVAAATALLGLGTAGVAFAHVTVQPGAAPKGGYFVTSVRVPNESATAGTTKVEIKLPQDHPLSSVRTQAVPGWTATLTKGPLAKPLESHGKKITEAVTSITWTANEGTKIGQGQYQDFPISLGPLPKDTDQLVLPAAQTYEDGNVVNWDQKAEEGKEEPEHPAPVLKLTAAVADGHGHGDEAEATASYDATARWLGGAGLIVGALGLGFGAGSVLRNRKKSNA